MSFRINGKSSEPYVATSSPEKPKVETATEKAKKLADDLAHDNFSFFDFFSENDPISSRTRGAEAERHRPKTFIAKPEPLSEGDPIARRTRGAIIKRAEQQKTYNEHISR